MTLSSIHERYMDARRFPKLSIFRDWSHQWVVVGPNVGWLGEQFNTWGEALDYVNRVRHN